MPKSYIAALSVLVLAGFASGCSSDRKESPAFAGALPKTWYQPPENSVTDIAMGTDTPGENTDRAVSAVFGAQASILEQLDAAQPIAPDHSLALVEGSSEAKRHWRLDGMIANFAVSVNGVFGALLGNGTPSVKVVWQKDKTTASTATPKKEALNVTAEMSDADLLAQMEPSIRTSLATGSIRNEKAFRAHLSERGKKFLALCKILRGLPWIPGWHVNGLQLTLSFNAEGQVTPIVGVGGGVTLVFNWEKPEGSEAPEPSAGPNDDSKLVRNLNGFAQIVAAELPAALKDAPELKKAGFALNEMHLGVAITAGGEIGLAQASGAVMAQLIFERDQHEQAPQGAEGTFIPLIGDSTRLHRIERKHFRKGLRRALRMGAYFADKARKKESAHWKVTQIEAELDVSIGGDLVLATVSGTGIIVLHFDRIEP